MFSATSALKHMAWGQGYSLFEANRKECWFLNICVYLSQHIRGYRISILVFEPLGMNSSYWLYVLLWWYRHFNGKRHVCMMWFYDVVVDLDPFALSSRALLDDMWNLVCFSSYVCLWLSPPSSHACFLFSVLWWKRFLRCSPFDEFKLWKSQVDNGSKKEGERLNILTRTLLLRRTKDQLDSAGKPLVIPLTLVAGWMWGVRKEGDHVLDSACTAVAFASGAPKSPMLLHRGPWVAVLPPGS